MKKKDQLPGYIVDEFGHNRTDIVSPADGIILYKVGTPPVNKGRRYFALA